MKPKKDNVEHFPRVDPKDVEGKPAVVVDLEEAPKAPNRPAHVIQVGNVQTRVWANPTDWGGVVWKIDQGCVYARPKSNGFAKSFTVEDLPHVERGAYLARKWVKKTEKRLRGRRLLPWD